MNLSAAGLKSNTESSSSGIAGLVAILVGIALGVAVGLLFGKSMWVAGSGPESLLTRRLETLAQKREFAAEAEENAEKHAAAGDEEALARSRARAERLQGHIPAIREDMDQIIAENQDHIAARLLTWTRARLEKLPEGNEDDRAWLEAHAAALAQNPAAERAPGFGDQLAFAGWTLTRFLGELFLQALKLLVIPLVVTSMICGITSLGDVRNMGRIGWRTIFYYMCTTAVAVTIGILLVLVIKPGVSADDTFAWVSQSVTAKEGTNVLDTLIAVFVGREGEPGSGMFPSNIFLAASDTNVLALIVFALVFGGALTTLGPQGRVAIDFFQAANEAVMKMVHLVMWAAPAGIFGLVAYNIAKNGGGEAFAEEVTRLGKYVGAVVLGLALHAVFLGSLIGVLGRRNPIRYTYGLLRALMTSVSTASSSATLPVTMECVEENNGVSNRSASFVLPLGATVNMDGTALYEAVAAIFIAQSLGMDLSLGQLIVIFLTATLAAIGAAGIPEAGLVTMVIVLTAVGIPTEGIGTILAVDWFLDRLRTTVNVYGDAIGAGVIDRFEQGQPAASS